MIRAIALVGLAASFAAGAADIQKCADNSGRITYQDSPCPRGSTIGTLPRESARGDPAAIQRLERERARIERIADAQLTTPAQQPAVVVPVPVPIQSNVAGATGEPVYTGPVYSVDPTTGAVIAPGVTVAPGVNQPIVAPSPITQPPTEVPGSTTQVPGTGTPLTQFPATQAAGATQSPAVMQLPSRTQSPPMIQAPPTTIGPGTTASPAMGGQATGR